MSSDSFFEVPDSLSISSASLEFPSLSNSTFDGDNNELSLLYGIEHLASGKDLCENEVDSSSASIITIDSLSTKSEIDELWLVSSGSESLSLTSKNNCYENGAVDSSSGSITDMDLLSTKNENDEPPLVSRGSESLSLIVKRNLYENEADDPSSGSTPTNLCLLSTKGGVCNSENNQPSLTCNGSETSNKHVCEEEIGNSLSASIPTTGPLPTKSEVCCNEIDKLSPLSSGSELLILSKPLPKSEVNNSFVALSTAIPSLPFKNHVSDSIVDSPSLSSSVTKFSLSSERHTCGILWRINDFNSITVKGQDCFSPSFAPPEMPNYQWFVRFRMTEQGDDESFEIFVEPGFVCGASCHLTYTLSVLNSNYRRIANWNVETTIASELESTQHYIKRSHVQNVLVSHDLFIRTDIAFELLPDKDEQESLRSFISMGSGHAFPGDLLSMLANESFSDVSISVDDAGTLYIIPAHRILLAARSSFFHAKLTQDTPERNEHCIKLNLDISTALNMLAFIYTDRINNKLSTKHIIQLLKCSNNYSIPGLKILCETHLIRRVKDSNVFDCLAAAYVYNAKELKTKCLEIICQSKKNIRRLKDALNSSLVEMTPEQRATLLPEIMMDIISNILVR